MPPAVIWDAMGTLLDVAPVKRAWVELGAPEVAFDAWFERTVHTAAALTLTGTFEPFPKVAAATLRTALASVGLDPDEQAPLEQLKQLAPVEDAAPALDVLEEAGVRSIVVTNGTEDATRSALARGGLENRIEQIVSVDAVRAFKPHRAPYAEGLRVIGREPQDVWLVAAHGWDVHAAQTYGMHAVWVDRLEREWPLPLDEPERRAHGLVEAARIVVSG